MTEGKGSEKTDRNASELRVLLAGILPGAWQHAVVPFDGVRVLPELALLDILLDRGVLLRLHNISDLMFGPVSAERIL